MTESDYIFTCPTGNVPIPHGLSLTEYILQNAYKFGSKLALIDGQNGRSYSYYQVTARVILREYVNLWTDKLAGEYQILTIQSHHKANEQLFIRVFGRGIVALALWEKMSVALFVAGTGEEEVSCEF